jgi:hypothetical protein
MAHIIDLHGRIEARQTEEQRLDLTAKMIPIMAAAIEKFMVMGASCEHIATILQATLHELKFWGSNQGCRWTE